MLIILCCFSTERLLNITCFTSKSLSENGWVSNVSLTKEITWFVEALSM